MLDTEQKVDQIQEIIIEILEMQKEMLQRQEEIQKDINSLRKEQNVAQTEIAKLNNKIEMKYLDLTMHINLKLYETRRILSNLY